MKNLPLLSLFLVSTFFISCSQKTSEINTKIETVELEKRELERKMLKTNNAIDEVNSEMEDREDWDEVSLVGYKTDLREANKDLTESKNRSRELNRNHRGLHIFGGGFFSYLTETSDIDEVRTSELYSEGKGYFFGLRYYGLGVEYRKVTELISRREKISNEYTDLETSSKFRDLEPFNNSYEVLQYHWLVGLADKEIDGADGYFKIGVDQILENSGYIYRKQESQFRPVLGLGWIWFSDYGIYLNMGVEASYWKQDEKVDEYGIKEYDDSEIWETQIRVELGLW
ncbi:hypothetical protein ThvES_00017430 [Thiovulum sp. ES]|nr:hypothetical protein ThvES_00017430 [Thiovulum sp. ES]